MQLLEARGLSVRLGGRRVLHKIDMSIAPGEIVTVIGPNGSGKSTLLRALIGAVSIEDGTVFRKRHLRIGYVPQRLGLEKAMPMTVRRFLGLPKRLSAAACEELLARVEGQGLADRQMSQLSGGQFQRVLLARALASEPEILILDEATQGLDQPAVAAFYQLIERLARDLNCAVLMVSHELHVVMRASDRVICLNGHVCCQGAPTVVSAAPEYRALFGDSAATLALYQHQHDHSHEDDRSRVPVGAAEH
ncbi:MAG: metal ABC transporter ATP-binding protein [Pseudomonadota bacterium]